VGSAVAADSFKETDNRGVRVEGALTGGAGRGANWPADQGTLARHDSPLGDLSGQLLEPVHRTERPPVGAPRLVAVPQPRPRRRKTPACQVREMSETAVDARSATRAGAEQRDSDAALPVTSRLGMTENGWRIVSTRFSNSECHAGQPATARSPAPATSKSRCRPAARPRSHECSGPRPTILDDAYVVYGAIVGSVDVVCCAGTQYAHLVVISGNGRATADALFLRLMLSPVKA
jgi:hypothetical protein